MPDVPQKTNPIAAFFRKVINFLINGVGARAIETYAETEVPVLAFPIVKQIFEGSVDYFVDKISFVVENGVVNIVIKVEEGTEARAVVDSWQALQAAKASGDQNAKQAALDKLYKTWGDSIHWGGISPRS